MRTRRDGLEAIRWRRRPSILVTPRCHGLLWTVTCRQSQMRAREAAAQHKKKRQASHNSDKDLCLYQVCTRIAKYEPLPLPRPALSCPLCLAHLDTMSPAQRRGTT
jgi:hypothetical protein